MSLTVQKKKIKRVSHLPQPILKLSGHTGPIYGLEFSFDGQKMVSCGKELLLWRTDKEVDNYGIIDIKRPVLQSRWSRDQTQIYCASAAQVLNIYDVDSGELVTSFKHNGIVNSCSANKRGQEMVCTGSDDGFIRVWDLRTSQAIKKYETRLPVTAVEFQIDGSFVYTGGIDETIKGWDLRTDTVSLQLEGHIDTILGLRLSPNGQHLLSNALDNTGIFIESSQDLGCETILCWSKRQDTARSTARL
ncbi:WD40-repeat-containing domain protein, partial [Gorgonomyces haynaldii]